MSSSETVGRQNRTVEAGEIVAPLDSTEIRNCAECGNPFEVPPFRIAAAFVKICPVCSEVRAELDMQSARERNTDQARRVEAWKRACPPTFLTTERVKIPNPVRYDRVMQWQFGPKGLVIHGPSGKGKSRCAWELVKREHMSGRRWAALDSSFAYEYAEQFQKPAECGKWVRSKTDVDLLLLDDVFKSKLSDSVEQALFTIINQRVENGRPTIITTNDTGETLQNRMSQDRGEAFVRRLREFFENIAFL
jgi:hypothetical protein